MSAPTDMLTPWLQAVEQVRPIRRVGRVIQTVGMLVESHGPAVSVGEVCRLEHAHGDADVLLEVVGFRRDRVLLLPLGSLRGVAPGSRIIALGHRSRVGVGSALLGRVIDGLGRPLDDLGPLQTQETRDLMADPPTPMRRQRIHKPLVTGVRSIDTLLTCGQGQRMGIFAGSGVGKSVLLGMIARNCHADLNVIALIGERGREIREFIERDLGPEGLQRSVIVAATSDQAPLVRLHSAYMATSIAEYFRDRGQNVMLVMDSLTRVAMAQREIGLSAGEPPATKGYPPSVFALLPRLLERSGMAAQGSITGLYTVLVEGDDMNDPIADTARSVLDGHVVLSRRLASENHYPAVDVLSSTSRVMSDVVAPEHRQVAAQLREWLAVYDEVSDLVQVGAYQAGSDPRVDQAVQRFPAIRQFLRQDVSEHTDLHETLQAAALLTQVDPT